MGTKIIINSVLCENNNFTYRNIGTSKLRRKIKRQNKECWDLQCVLLFIVSHRGNSVNLIFVRFPKFITVGC